VLGIFFYNIFLWVYRAGVHIAALFNPKASQWLSGRKDWKTNLEKMIGPGHPVIWFHCASLGEFEQGRPVLENVRRQYPGYRILLSFFSPSGYEVKKDYSGADWVIYLPLDGPVTAKQFLEITRPALVIFVKYEFWFYYLKKIFYRKIPLLLISAYFRPEMGFFKWHGALQRKMLSRFHHIFVQDERSKTLLEKIGFTNNVSISGDTRYDRVRAIAEKSEPIPAIDSFGAGHALIVAGSTWPEDEALLSAFFHHQNRLGARLVIAPHEVDEKHIASLLVIFPRALRFSMLSPGLMSSPHEVLIIDNIGMLSRLYRHAQVCYVGGALRPQGLHNILEAAVYGKPVLFGPYYQKYHEATGLIEAGGAFSIRDAQEFSEKVNGLLENAGQRETHGRSAAAFVASRRGATEKILHYIQENRLLTS
jgi:3-deoxy-D-manno-octulosonic-acid transferase